VSARVVLAALVALLLAAGVSCVNPFAPKLDTELASQACTGLMKTDDVFCVFRNAYAFKDTTLYGSILAPDFTFLYTDYDLGVDVSWGRAEEMRSAYGLFASVQSLTLTWNDELSSEGTDTARTIIRGFNLTVTFNPSDVTRIDGYANLKFARATVNDSWKIVRWRDESNY
jgi:hypothetical protein